jgi:hypothetical protein
MMAVSSGANAVSLSIRTGAQGDRTFVIALRGEVDYTSASQFREEVSALLAGGVLRVLVVDLKRSPSWTPPASARWW